MVRLIILVNDLYLTVGVDCHEICALRIRQLAHQVEAEETLAVKFTPEVGPGGKRQIEAVVTNGSIPLMQKSTASFKAPAEQLPSRVAAMRVQRGSGNLVISFASSSGASHFAVSAKLSDGRELAYYVGARCHALKIKKVPAGVGATLKVAGVRYDLKMGRANSISIRAKAKSAGKKSKKLKKGKVCS
jgi:hypothetical protein